MSEAIAVSIKLEIKAECPSCGGKLSPAFQKKRNKEGELTEAHFRCPNPACKLHKKRIVAKIRSVELR